MDDLARLALAAAGVGGIGFSAELALGRPSVPSASPVPAALPTANAERPGRAYATPPVPRLFDAIFAQQGRGIPVAYLRALAWNESRLDPRARARTSSAVGLLQIIDVVRVDHNRLHGTAYTRDDLLDPVVNVAIAAGLLERIAHSFARNHPKTPNLLADWNNYRFVELLTVAWNAGWSERAGVGRVARYLEDRGRYDVTIELVREHALAAGATRHLQNPAKVQWCKQVARQYAAERTRDAIERRHELEPPRVAVAPDLHDAAPVHSPEQVDPTPPTPSPTTAPIVTTTTTAALLDPYPDRAPSGPLDPYPT